jgi:hypothetical protein
LGDDQTRLLREILDAVKEQTAVTKQYRGEWLIAVDR